MKNVCMYVVITMLFASAAFSAEPTVDFDQGSAQPVGMMSVVDNVYVNPQLAVRNNTMITIPATKPQGSSAILPPMKEVLKDVPSEDRAEFLNSLAFKEWAYSLCIYSTTQKNFEREKGE